MWLVIANPKQYTIVPAGMQAKDAEKNAFLSAVAAKQDKYFTLIAQLSG